jgi:putative ABC transport system permease protein
MNILFIISWRNIWRNPVRSLIIIGSVMTGLWAGIFVSSLSHGMIRQGFKTRIEQQVSHIQIHHPDYLKDRVVSSNIPNFKDIFDSLEQSEEIAGFTGRSLVDGMIQTASVTRGVTIVGIDPDRENQTTKFADNIKEGDYFESINRNPILIGRKLAEKMKLELRSRLVLTFQDLSGEITAASFRVCGIYETINSTTDEQHVYVLQSDISRLLGGDAIIHEVAILAKNMDVVGSISESLRADFPNLLVREWMEIAPDLMYMHEMSSVVLLVVVGIILFALAFGLVNTMLMSVFERTRELGMLMSVGMNKLKVFTMILLETTYLTLLGSFLAILAGLISIAAFSRTGIDLNAVGGDSMNDFGFDALVYPALDPVFFVYLIFLVILASILSALYPAYKALKLKPAEAVRKD